jgi:5-methylcytosine-specific restriction endonuclease McrA
MAERKQKGGKVTVQKKLARERAWNRQRGLCFYCKKNVPRDKATLEHRVPACLGGNLQNGNAVMTCRECNEAKGNMPEEVFLAGEDARRAWRWEREQAWRDANSGEAASYATTAYGDLIGASAQRARAIMAVQQARRTRRSRGR